MAEMTEDGILEWRDAGGELHRVGGPAVVHANGSVKYYENGVRHRDGAPACDGVKVKSEKGPPLR